MDKILVICATKSEATHFFPNIKLPPLKMGKCVNINFKKREILLLICGIGPLNAAIFTERVLSHTMVKGILNIGIAGAFNIEKTPIGSICVACKEIWPEYGLRTEQGVDPYGLNYGLYKLKNNKIIFNEIEIPIKQNLEKMGLSFMNIFYTSISLTVAGVTGTSKEASKLYTKYNADIENMEGFSIAYVAMLHNIPFVEIRTISNMVGSRDTKHWDIKKAISSLKNIQGIFK